MKFDDLITLLWDSVAIQSRIDYTASFQQIFPYARNRVAVLFSTGGSQEITLISGRTPDPTASQTRVAINLHASQNPTLLTRLQVGRWILGPIFGRTTGGADSASAIEFLASDTDNAMPPAQSSEMKGLYPHAPFKVPDSAEGPQAFQYGRHPTPPDIFPATGT